MEKLNVDFTNVSSFGLILIKAGMANRRAKSLYDIRDWEKDWLKIIFALITDGNKNIMSNQTILESVLLANFIFDFISVH